MSCTIPVSELNKEYVHLSPSRTQTSPGQHEQDGPLTNNGTIRGMGQSNSGKEVEEASALVGDIDEIIYILPDQAMGSNDILQNGGREFRVQVIIQPSREVYKKLLCRETQRGN